MNTEGDDHHSIQGELIPDVYPERFDPTRIQKKQAPPYTGRSDPRCIEGEASPDVYPERFNTTLREGEAVPGV